MNEKLLQRLAQRKWLNGQLAALPAVPTRPSTVQIFFPPVSPVRSASQEEDPGSILDRAAALGSQIPGLVQASLNAHGIAQGLS